MKSAKVYKIAMSKLPETQVKVPNQKGFVSVPQAATITNSTRQAVWRNIQRGAIPAFLVGNRYVVPYASVRILLRRRIAEGRMA